LSPRPKLQFYLATGREARHQTLSKNSKLGISAEPEFGVTGELGISTKPGYPGDSSMSAIPRFPGEPTIIAIPEISEIHVYLQHLDMPKIEIDPKEDLCPFLL
jgi:hypothetical protein